ncbi:signal peptidase II [Aquicella lusitana]|uniref:Lipoprotein signal peptidase n=1 Tax=Aquicella lusitana TaxID=254246 RepID=A0A370GHI4_9COXI|nr:signal peptidase II [Aquicella lusitana]RDI42820.1 signal peptidase II [Aquicella lusitana]VVC73063.1 Lipoprotein signal peptidase [Aquicella lusitana]
MRKYFSTGLNWLWIALLVVLIDRYAKYWAVHNLTLTEPLPIFSVFNLTLAYNKGAAFSFLHNASGWQNLFLGSLAAIVSLFILGWLWTLSARERWTNIALCLVLGGAIGNAWDRILYGYVIDFFDFHLGDWHFAIFNTADSAICVGAAMLLWHWLRSPDRGSH